jgi:hypothetical protein
MWWQKGHKWSTMFKLTQQQTNNWEVDKLLLQVISFPLSMFHHQGRDESIAYFSTTTIMM